MGAPPKELADRPQWLVWRFEKNPKKPDGKQLKVPYYANGGWRFEDLRQGDQGSPGDRVRLVTYAQAIGHAPEPGKGGVGFAFLPGDGLIGIDLDSMIDTETGEIQARAVNIIKECDSYTELSPSKKGMHIIVAGDTGILFEDGKRKSFKLNKIGVEVFCGSQYFTFTGDRYAGTPDEIRPIAESTLRRLYVTVKPRKQATPSAASAAPAPADDDFKRAEAALAYVDADEYQQWIDIGMVLKHAFGEAAFSLWDRWSQKSPKYPGSEAAKKWATFNPNGSLTLGTLFELAKRGGYRPPPRPRALSRSQKKDRADPPPPGGDEPPDDGAGDDGKSLPKIRWVQGKLPEVVDQAEHALLESKMRIYQRSGFLVRVVKRETPSVRYYKRRPPGALGIVTVDAPFLIESFTRAAYWEKFNAKSNDWLRCNAPEQAAVTYIARRGHWRLPHLWSAISSPTLRPDGTILQKPGYDEAMQTWYDPLGAKFPEIQASPSKDDAVKALKVLTEAFESFPFESKVDLAIALSLALTALVRRSLPSAPMGAITAPVMASGKTLLADCISILGTSVSAPAMKYADTDEEFTKTMLAVLAEGDQVVLIDNVERPLEGDTLCAVLTSEGYRQRVLGRTEMMTVPTTTLFLATGNHLVISGDLRTRALMCRLDPKHEHPEQRQFNVEKRTWMTDHRAELVAAGLTIMRAFIATGQNPIEQCNTWGRFELWSNMVRAPLLWLDCEDPCLSLKELEREDPERNELVRVIVAWRDAFGDEGRTARECCDRATDVALGGGDRGVLNLALRDVCKDRDGSLNPKKLGHWLAKHAGRIVSTTDGDGAPGPAMKLVRDKKPKDHTLVWKVETLTNR